jgi:glycine/D-amino acid oxidase-like deaminating enzyme
VRGWRPDGAGVVVETDRGPLAAARLVIAPGAWAGQLLADLRLPLQVRRKPLFWFPAAEPRHQAGSCPTFLFQRPDGAIFYGFPSVDGHTIKCAEHTGGRDIDDPLGVDRGLDEGELGRVREFLRAHLPGVGLELVKHAVCMYTLTPDEHFVLDRHPAHPQVALCAGLSGHGYKLVPVLGEALAQLLLDGGSPHPLGFLRLDRPALRPGATPTGLLAR